MISKQDHQQIEDAPAASQQQMRPFDSRLVNLDTLAKEVAREISRQRNATPAEHGLEVLELIHDIIEQTKQRDFQLYREDCVLPFLQGGVQSEHGGLRIKAEDADTLRSFYLGQAGDLTDSADPERRLARLRSLGGSATYKHGEWQFKGISALVALEKNEERKRSDEKTIRADLKEAAENELVAKRAGAFSGLGSR